MQLLSEEGLPDQQLPPLQQLLQGRSFDDLFAFTPPPNEQETEELDEEENQVANIIELQDEIRKLKQKNSELQVKVDDLQVKVDELVEQKGVKRIEEETSPADLQNIAIKLKKGEEKNGYEFENTKYFRIMSVLHRPHSSVRELVASLLVCSVKINRKCGDYGERQPKRGRDEEKGEKAPKKRKRD